MERKFLPVNISLLTVSVTRVLENDMSGNLLANKIEQSGHILFERKIVKDEILGKSERDIPIMLDYRSHIDKKSMFNTPPVFSVYVSMLNLRWLKSKGGLDYIEKNNNNRGTRIISEMTLTEGGFANSYF